MHCALDNGVYQENDAATGYSIVFASYSGDAACQRFVNARFDFAPGPNRRVWSYAVSYASRHGDEVRASGTLMRPH